MFGHFLIEWWSMAMIFAQRRPVDSLATGLKGASFEPIANGGHCDRLTRLLHGNGLEFVAAECRRGNKLILTESTAHCVW